MSDVSSSSQDNFDKSRTMMDNIGEHCTICNRLDFLPYTCQVCHKSFCSNHRQLYNEHPCVKNAQDPKKFDVSHLPPSATLFPDRNHNLGSAGKPNSILSTLEAKSAKEDNVAKAALAKLKLFLKKNKTFSITKKKPMTTSSKIIEIANLKKKAVGDAKIPVSERIYINVQYIPSLDELEKSSSKDSTPLAIYVSRSWPIGRLLDQASLHLKIKNENNKTQDVEKKLTIFRSPRLVEKTVVEPVYIPANSRVMKEVQDGDLLYLVRGAAV